MAKLRYASTLTRNQWKPLTHLTVFQEMESQIRGYDAQVLSGILTATSEKT